jgi:hypothetical protein
MPQVQGQCPMGCGEGLILGEGGVLWCAALLCPRPTAAAEILADGEAEHVVVFTPGGWTIRHPLRERLGDALMACALAESLNQLITRPVPAGRYLARQVAEGWGFEPLPT